MIEVEKVITKKCSDSSIYTAVEARGSSCFEKCGLFRNTTSACWIGCFYKTILGPAGMLPFPDTDGGLTTNDLVAAWNAPFATEDTKLLGCPNVPVPSKYARL